MLDCKLYFQPESLTVALDLLAKAEKRLLPLAGGTDIVPAMSKNKLNVAGLVDLSKIQELHQIKIEGNEISLGSLCTFQEIETSHLIRTKVPLLADAAGLVGSPQIRNAGTVGGNIANASPAADTVTALIALDADVRLRSTTCARTMPLKELLCGAGKTRILPQEIITEITFRILQPGSKAGFIKLGRRKALAIARMNMALIFSVTEGRIIFTRVGLGAVGPNPCRSNALENTLIGQEPSDSLVEDFVMEAEREVARMLGLRPSAAYKCEAVKGIARDILSSLFSSSEMVVE